VHVWSAETGERVTVLDGGHPGPTSCVQFNPKLMMMATACTSMVSGYLYLAAPGVDTGHWECIRPSVVWTLIIWTGSLGVSGR